MEKLSKVSAENITFLILSFVKVVSLGQSHTCIGRKSVTK